MLCSFACLVLLYVFFFSSRRRHTRLQGDWSSDVCSSDLITLDIAAQPVIMVRHTDGSVRLLMNRCAHKGTKVVGDLAGNTGKTFRCPYHRSEERRVGKECRSRWSPYH